MTHPLLVIVPVVWIAVAVTTLFGVSARRRDRLSGGAFAACLGLIGFVAAALVYLLALGAA